MAQRELRFHVASVLLLTVCTGCTNWREYVRNGFKVGPDYRKPAAPVAESWIDAADSRVSEESPALDQWWTVFNDPVLDRLIHQAATQNLTLQQAGFRVLQARAQLGIVHGEVFPQQQDMSGFYRRLGAGGEFFDQWGWGFSLAWELDFWGRFRRAVQAADARLNASVEDYDGVLVTLLGDVANNYVIVRTNQERIRLLQQNIEIQQAILTVGEDRLRIGQTTSVNVEQLRSNLLQNAAQVEQLHVGIRQAANGLCILMGIPPQELTEQLGDQPIPVAPADIAIGIPADLVRRRPDVRRAERLVAAQAEQIGIAEAELYPAIFVTGTFGYEAQHFPDLFSSRALTGSVGPSFQWNLLNYGRLVNNIRLQDATLQERIAAYQQTVLSASAEVEDGVVTFLRAQRRAELLDQSAAAAQTAVWAIREQLRAGAIDFNQYAVIQQNLIQQQDLWAQARGEIALGLIQVYRALGGGWQIRLAPAPVSEVATAPAAPPPTQPTPGVEPTP
jgi:NodT family efflux transporter outer membrane factor (OMF) lipoprotein